jgi:OOP family OmpA-OmpF porin
MMRFVLVAIFFISSALVGTNQAAAQEDDKYVFVLGGYVEHDFGLDLENGHSWRLGLGKELGKWANIEGALGYTQAGGVLGPNLDTFSLGSDIQLVLGRGNGIEPYLFAGFEVLRLDASDSKTESEYGGSVGAGFRGRFSGEDGFLLRAEYRYRVYETSSLNVDDEIISIGFDFPFGKASPVIAPPAPVLDDDNDGVVNDRDRCPNTPAGVRVDANGCALDSDGDGVADHADKCPGTVRGATVDENGCEMDGDEDGVVDRLDECPDSAPGAQVDIRGCEIQEEIRLPGVNFESNSDRLLPGAESTLNDAAATLDKNPEIKVEVAGHTDSDGAAEYNESLSARRAATVRDYLISRGIAEDRLTTRGYGEAQPITGNDTAEGKAANRRVVLRVTAR